MRQILGFAFLASASLAFGQLDSNSVTATASRNTSLQPDEALFSVTVSSGTNTSLSDVLAALQGSGITLVNFSSVGTVQALQLQAPPSQPPPPVLDWVFGLPVPLSKIKDTVALLAALQQSLSQKNSGLSLAFTLQGTQVSTQLQQTQTCSIPDLLADARAKAQKLADAAGLSVGTILALSTFTSSAFPGPAAVSASFLGSFVATQAFTAAPNCSIVVKFALGRF